MGWAAWYTVSAANFACKNHPRPARALVRQVSEYTHLSETDAEHVLERLRHLKFCLDEPSTITLFRLQPGKNQEPKDRSPVYDGEFDAESLRADDDDERQDD